jgi:hypothetical protein
MNADGTYNHTAAWRINDSGTIVGYYLTGPTGARVAHGFVRKGESVQTLDYVDSDGVVHDTELLGINDRGTIVGTYDFYSWGLIATPTHPDGNN